MPPRPQTPKPSQAQNQTPKRDIFKELPWIVEEPFGLPYSASESPLISVTWFIPPVGQGSGGHLNIFRFVRMLEERGFDCRIVICHDPRNVSGETAYKEIQEWFFPLKAPVFMHPGENIPSSDFAFATGWQTAYVVQAFRSCRQRLYFIQDYEPWFYEAGGLATFAEATYRFGFTAITAGDWLAELLERDYSMKTRAVGFGVDHQLFSPRPRPQQEGPQVFFYARPPTARRGFELGLFALELLSKRIPDLTIHLAGWPMGDYHIPFRHVDHGVLALEHLADLYSQCDAALVFSFSNLSLLPLEIMACGCPVVSNAGANVEWLLNHNNALLVPATAQSIAEGLELVLTDNCLWQKLVTGGLNTAHSSNWEKEGENMAHILQALAQ